MKLVRSWPATIPAGRSYVVDDAERLVISAHDYQPLRSITDDLLLLEWDIAVGAADLNAFVSYTREDPTSVIVAPYILYTEPEPVWAHRFWSGEGGNTPDPGSAIPVYAGAPTCNLFGLGMVYLPKDIVAAFFASGYATHAGDVEFSMWHYRNVAEDVRITWDVLPVHLNYSTKGIVS